MGLSGGSPLAWLLLLITLTTASDALRQHTAYRPGDKFGIRRESRSVASDWEQLPANLTAPIELIDVERRYTSQRNRFTIHLRKNGENKQLKFFFVDGLDIAEKIPDRISQDADEIWTVSFTVDFNNATNNPPFPRLWISSGKSEHLAIVELNNTDTLPRSQHIPSMPAIYVRPQGEAVYEPGQDVNITAAVYGVTQNSPDIFALFTGADIDTGKYIPNSIEHSIQGHPHRVDNRVQTWVAMDTSTNHLSGFLQLLTDVSNTGGSLVSRIVVMRQVIVKPTNQSEVYPRNYITILDESERNQNGSGLYYCRDPICRLRCVAIGNNVTNLEVFKVKSNGSLENVPSAQISPVQADRLRILHWTFEKEGSIDSDHITTFQCRAYGSNNSQMFTRRVDVQTSRPDTIDEERS